MNHIKIIGLITSTLVVLLAISCKQEKKKGFTVSTTQDVTIENEFRITLPDYLRPATNLNDVATLQYSNIQKETYVIVISEPKQGFIDSHIEIGYYDESMSTIENYSNRQLSLMQQNVSMSNIDKSKKIRINGRAALMVDFDGTLNSSKSQIYYSLGFVEGKEKIFMIMTWTLLSRKDTYTSDFKEIIKSFKLIGN